jgi:tetratricopeptide (TPR) repeat protein
MGGQSVTEDRPMRIGSVSVVVSVLIAVPSAAQDPPLPLPVLPAATDTAALRAALRIPLDPPDYRFHFDDTGRFDVLDRSAEATARIAAIKSKLKNNPADAERYDELRLWHHRLGGRDAVRDCAVWASRCYRERLRTDPYNADLLTRCGEALIEAEDLPEAERRLRKAVAANPDCWRAWFLLARVQIDSAYALQAVPAPRLADESIPNVRPTAPLPRSLPAELRVDLPPAPEVAPPPQQVKPAGFSLPSRVVDWSEVAKLSDEAASCLDEAIAVAPHEPAMRFARCCQRKLAAEVEAATEGATMPFDPFNTPDNLADLRAAVTADTDDPEVISVVTWFEITAAQKRLERADDPAFRRQTYTLVCERIEQLECIAAGAEGPTAARAALLAAHLCRKIGQPFRAGVQVRFAIAADPDSRAAWEAYLASLAESGPPSEYVTASRRAAERFDSPAFYLRWADALARSGDTAEALHVLDQLEHREPDNVPARLAEATLRLQSEGATALPRVNELLDAAESTLRLLPPTSWQTECALLRACSQLIGGNAALGRVLLEDLAKREPWHPRVKAALATVADD